MSKVYIGIDPGKSGGFAVIVDGIAETFVYDDLEFIAFLEQYGREKYKNSEVIVCLEKVGAMPGQGVVSMFNFGQSYGFIKGSLEAFSIPFQLVSPQTWKKEFSLNSSKELSIEVCRRLFPTVNLMATPRCKKAHDGMAEALLMAEYARRKF